MPFFTQFTNRVLARFGLRLDRLPPPHGAATTLSTSRVTIAGLSLSIQRARELFPERTVVVFTDEKKDAHRVPFSTIWKTNGGLISGDPERDLTAYDVASTAFVFGFDSDEKISTYLAWVTQRGGKYFCAGDASNARWWHIRDTARKVLQAEEADCRRHGHSHFALDQLTNLTQAIDITRAIPGDYVEIGVFKGTSARLAYHYMGASNLARHCTFMDTWAGFDYVESKESADAHWQGTHEASMEQVATRLEATPLPANAPVSFTLVRSNIMQDNLPATITSIALCNIDVDIYDAIATALHKTWPLIATGGICIVQDPGRTPLLGGARLALDEFLRDPKATDCVPVYLESGQTFLLKV
ncbi:TylF/MycF/NovP-related O-methyltransferase [Synoicihabitans lomoniglobus]|uniref:Macrocin O-methyltransferase n=1 Tax=Synoicihabitans lomoniglobus TaxID=2909285 RepID=A0AAE9ZY81_9BACT|nr:TylF/MycF family methyltransferase [Opitutaceae bacterium LMO-M01]WED65384.1 macrocin O-methyltransferase [Opitutaceae bacterium LMO-M01]